MAMHDEPVVLVGWSLGGYIAREYAREHPGHVRAIVTLGSPVIGGPRYTATAERAPRRSQRDARRLGIRTTRPGHRGGSG